MATVFVISRFLSPYRRYSQHVQDRTLGYCLFTAEQLAEFRAWDQAFITALYTTLLPALRRAATLHSEGGDDVEDLLQETWITAEQSRLTYRGDAPVIHWFLKILDSIGRGWSRTHLRRQGKLLLWSEQSASDVDQIMNVDTINVHMIDADERRLSLIHAIFRLSPRQTDVLIARFLGEHSLGQIAHLLHVAQGTVKATLAQALDRLREILSHHNIDEWF